VEILKDHDARAPIQEAKDLFEQRPEMVAAFRRVLTQARDLTPDQLIQRIERPNPD